MSDLNSVIFEGSVIWINNLENGISFGLSSQQEKEPTGSIEVSVVAYGRQAEYLSDNRNSIHSMRIVGHLKTSPVDGKLCIFAEHMERRT